ncbi:MAG: aminotransferase IV [Chloroflexi bacterium]|nr:aminotransferase IV [Chloroflexota bacterium]
MKALCYINGRIQSVSDASIGVVDLGLQRGYGVFDFGRTYHGKLFHLGDNLARFRRSASELHLKPPVSDKEITEIVEQLIRGSNLKTPAVRLILTGGYSYASPALERPNLIIIAEELPTYPNDVYTQGAKLITIQYQRELPHIKSINYLNAIRLDPLKRKKKAFDILYHSQHGVTECPRNNFFIFRGDTLVTPQDHVLYGITRKLVLQLARDQFFIEERPISLNELEAADEAFVTSTSKCVIPIVRINNFDIGSGSVGTHTKTIMRLFANYADNYRGKE